MKTQNLVPDAKVLLFGEMSKKFDRKSTILQTRLCKMQEKHGKM